MVKTDTIQLLLLLSVALELAEMTNVKKFNNKHQQLLLLQQENVLLKEQNTKQQETFAKQINLLEQRAKAREDETNHRLDELSSQFPSMQEAQTQFAHTKRN